MLIFTVKAVTNDMCVHSISDGDTVPTDVLPLSDYPPPEELMTAPPPAAQPPQYQAGTGYYSDYPQYPQYPQYPSTYHPQYAGSQTQHTNVILQQVCVCVHVCTHVHVHECVHHCVCACLCVHTYVYILTNLFIHHSLVPSLLLLLKSRVPSVILPKLCCCLSLQQ